MDDKKWKLIQDMLAAEASGQTLRPVVSQRTLFGIPSSVDVALERIVAEDEAARRAKRKQAAKEQAESEQPLPRDQERPDVS